MKTEVSISERLKDLRVEKKLNLEELAELTGISKSALGSYELDTPREMNHKNLIALAGFYEVSVDYLLGQTENRSIPNEPLSELRLSDAMVELLKSGRINNRLLCELVTHEKFAELMADVEIYVDGLAASRFHDLKQSLAADRARLLEEHPEAVTDRAFRIFDAGMIEEDDFFCHITHKAWDAILHDIRKAHEKDFESAPVTTPADEIFMEIRRIVQSPVHNTIDTFVEAFCKGFQIKSKNLPPNEKAALIKIFKRSPVIKNSGISFRRRK